jgi:phosphate ABC transporter, permease protein PstC
MKNTALKFRNNFAEFMMRVLSFTGVLIILFIFIFVFMKAMPVLWESGIGLLYNTGFDKQISEAFNSSGDPVYTFGLLGLIAGTLLSTGIALIAAVILGVGAAIVIAEFVSPTLRRVLEALVRLLASIPSVVFGLVGIIILVPFVENTFITTDLQIKYLDYFQLTGRGLLSSALVLVFMIVPMIITMSVDALRAVPHRYKETGFAFGMSHFRVVWKIVLPSARSGIIAGIILAAGRGVGEAIAISMVCGGLGLIPDPSMGPVMFLAPILTLSSAIVNKSEAMSVPAVESALFACGAVLLVIGAFLSIAARAIERKLRRNAGYVD